MGNKGEHNYRIKKKESFLEFGKIMSLLVGEQMNQQISNQSRIKELDDREKHLLSEEKKKDRKEGEGDGGPDPGS